MDITDCLSEYNPNQKGVYVLTKSKQKGVVYYNEDFINGKAVVHTEVTKLLCDPESLTIIGFFD